MYLKQKKQEFDQGGFDHYKWVHTAPDYNMNDTLTSFKSWIDDLEWLKKRDLDL